MKRLIFAATAIAAILLAASCSSLRKAPAGQSVGVLPLPSHEEACVIVKDLLASVPCDTALVYPVQLASGPCMYAFAASRDSSAIRVVKVLQKGSEWALDSVVGYPCLGSDGLLFAGYEDTLARHVSEQGDFLSFGAIKSRDGDLSPGPGNTVKHVILLFKMESESLEALSFTGKVLKDGRIEGSSDRSMVVGMNRPWMAWAARKQDEDARFVVLSDADVMTDQAIEWWLEKNPAALTGASSVRFGSLPEECSLVSLYRKARGRQTSGSYGAALFDYRGYTVVVVKKANGYNLAWAEPECTDHARGRLLNNIYFEQGSNLVLFYYQGRKTFKYRLSLANGSLKR